MNLVTKYSIKKLKKFSLKWKGPGFVIRQDGKIIFFCHGSIYVRVSANRIMKLNDEVKIPPEENVSEKKVQQSAQSLQLAQKKIKKMNQVLLMKLGKRIIKKILLIVLPLLPQKLMIPVIFQFVTSETETERNSTVLEDKMPKCKCSFEYKIKPTDEWRKATV